jgi:hypothetical protein
MEMRKRAVFLVDSLTTTSTQFIATNQLTGIHFDSSTFQFNVAHGWSVQTICLQGDFHCQAVWVAEGVRNNGELHDLESHSRPMDETNHEILNCDP